jgi:uncharacterized protein
LLQEGCDGLLAKNNLRELTWKVSLFFIMQKQEVHIMKVTDKCALNCTYCAHEAFLGNLGLNKETLDPELVGRYYKKMRPTRVIPTIFHGGDPTLWGLENFRKLFQIQSEMPQLNFKRSIQVNGTCLTPGFLGLMKDNGIDVGVSYDGISHNETRHFRNGESSEEAVLKGMASVRATIGRLATISVVGATNQSPQAMYRSLRDNNVDKICFLRFRPEGTSAENLSISPAEFASFLIGIYDEWIREGDPKVVVREIQGVIRRILGKGVARCSLMGDISTCSTTFTLTADGYVRPCEGMWPLVFSGRIPDSFGKMEDGAAFYDQAP